MNPLMICLGIFILLSGFSTLLFLAASMNSSRMSQAYEGYEQESGYRSEPIPVSWDSR